LGFNRAILFLVDKEAQMLRVAMAVGALTAEEAYATWARLAAERKTLWDFLREYPGDTAVRQAPLMQRVHDLVVRLDEDNLLTLCLRRHEPLRIANPRGELRLPERLRQVLSDSDAICVPLVAQEEPLGLIVADNAFSRHPITEEAERLLRLFASSASIALRNAQLIAQLKDALRREQAMREQLVHSERLAAIGELAAKVAHDLRSPLVTIGGYARQLERHPSDPERVMRNAQIIVDEVERLERQLRDLLDFAKPSPPKPQRCALTELVQRLVEVHRPSMEAGRVRVVAELSDDPCWVLADEMQIERLLMNLWRNAVEAMPDGGVLTVKVWRDGAQVRLRIKDTGVGISPEALPHIFKPFYTTKHGGTGLGLAIAQKIVAEHSGTLEIHSEVGVGTTVDIALPAAPA
jgi:signal transduction histidine kinase